MVRPSVLRPIGHDYPDALPAPARVRCYGFEEVFAEKIRAMGERARPRDLYDIVNLFRRPDFRQHGTLVREILEEKCRLKDVPMPSAEGIRTSPMFEELDREWANMLAHQLRALPDFEHFWAEVPHVFAWLNGDETEVPEPVVLGGGDELWTPPPIFWTSGPGSRLEPIRFAAANRLLVDLGCRGEHRLIEPYSLRQTQDGNVVLHAICADSGEHRSYRVDRIQSVTATNRPFRPRYAIEFPGSGPIPPLTARRSPGPTRARNRPSRRTLGPTYIVRCPTCQKAFRRVRRNTRLRPHKDPDGVWSCPARNGYIERVE